eukprot:COSAG01_NODE_65032_length_274_cov_1.022857_1_plen_32_part_10
MCTSSERASNAIEGQGEWCQACARCVSKESQC